MKNEENIKDCLVEELDAMKETFHIMSDERIQNCVGYCEALCWILGRDQLSDLIKLKFFKPRGISY